MGDNIKDNIKDNMLKSNDSVLDELIKDDKVVIYEHVDILEYNKMLKKAEDLEYENECNIILQDIINTNTNTNTNNSITSKIKDNYIIIEKNDIPSIQNISVQEQKNIKKQDKYKKFTKIKKLVNKGMVLYNISNAAANIALFLL